MASRVNDRVAYQNSPTKFVTEGVFELIVIGSYKGFSSTSLFIGIKSLVSPQQDHKRLWSPTLEALAAKTNLLWNRQEGLRKKNL